MLFSPVHLERCYAFAARRGRWILAVLIPAVAIIAFGVGCAAGSPLLGAGFGVFIVVLWSFTRELISLRNHLAVVRQDRAAMEEALREAQKLEAVGRLAAGIAHDFNNHLTVISSNVELIKHRLGSGQDRLIRHADAAMQGVQRAAMLTGRLLSFARQSSPDPEAIDVGRLLHGLSDLLGRTLGEGMDLEVRLPDAQWFVWADVHEMENALLSLAVSLRQRVSNGGALALAVCNVALDSAFVAAHRGMLPGDYVRLTLGDATSVTAAAQPGSGVMWQCHSPADNSSNAEFSLASGFARGAGGCLLQSGAAADTQSVCLLLPRHKPPAPSGSASREAQAGRPRVLVVEDDAAVRDACVETLRGSGYEVIEAPDAMEAFRLIADHGGVDLLLTDLGLPGGVSGRALADAARNVDPAMQVIFISGYASAEMHERGGCILVKPFTQSQLAEKVRQAMGMRIIAGRAETV
jgi:CheY-like chemotaxis protein